MSKTANKKVADTNNTKAGNKAVKLSDKLIKGHTIPIILIVVGILTFPLGIIAWVFALMIYLGVFSSTDK